MWNEGEKTTETLEDLMRLPAAPPLTVPRIYHTAVGQRPDHARACPTASSVVTSGVPDHGVCGCFYFQRLADTRYSWNRDLMEDPTLFACMPIFLGVFFERSRACLGVVLFSFFAEKHSYDLILDSTVIFFALTSERSLHSLAVSLDLKSLTCPIRWLPAIYDFRPTGTL